MNSIKKGFFRKIVGLSVLVIGLATGIVLVSQNQDFREKASDELCTDQGFETLCRSGTATDADGQTVTYEVCMSWKGAYQAAACKSGSSNSSVECNSDAECKSPRKCQNHQCIGNPGESKIVSCKNDGDCRSGQACVKRICVAKKFVK